MAKMTNKKCTVIMQGFDVPIAVAAHLEKLINELTRNGIFPIINPNYVKINTSDNKDCVVSPPAEITPKPSNDDFA